MIKFENICTKKTFKGSDGTEKTKWLVCGTLKTTDQGKRFIEMNNQPDTTFYVFEKKEKEENTGL